MIKRILISLCILMSLVAAPAIADCGDCGMSNHEYYGGK